MSEKRDRSLTHLEICDASRTDLHEAPPRSAKCRDIHETSVDAEVKLGNLAGARCHDLA